MELVKVNGGEYWEYEELLLERDHERKAAGQIWTAYQKMFGKLITDLFQARLECVRRKKMIAYYQKAINRGRPVDRDAMEEWLAGELLAYRGELDRMLKEYRQADASGTSTAYEVRRSKQIYRRIAKLIHPDIYPETDRHEELTELWNRALIAYGMNDVKELAEIEVLVRKAMKELGLYVERPEIPDIGEKIGELKKEIETIRTTKPYTYRYLVENEDAAARETAKLKVELASYLDYVKELDGKIEEIINERKVSFKWRMN